MIFTQEDQVAFIRVAQQEAEQAIKRGYPPFGAVIVDEHGTLLASAYNTASPATGIIGHAEINLIRQLARDFRRTKLRGCAIFINAASCSMCASALIQAGVRDFYYGAPLEPHTNPAVSYEQLAVYCSEPLRIQGGILGDACAAQIQQGRTQTAKAKV